MTNAEDQAREEYAKAGVDLPELQEKKEDAEGKEEGQPEPKPEPKSEETPADADEKPAEKQDDSKEKAPLQDEPKEQRKRSIYDDYKDTKKDLKSEKELREQVERERDDWKTKFEALGKAETPEEKKEATDEIESFAKKIGADPAAIREMRDLFLKDNKPATDPELLKRLDSFETWQKANSQVIEKAAFEEEFQASTPKLKTLFPKASPEEMLSIKKELDAISHTKDWHDKPLAYIAFEHQEKLSALISPKKRGMESNDRKADAEADSWEFDPNADLSSMSSKERELWEAHYKGLGKTDGLSTGANGKKILI